MRHKYLSIIVILLSILGFTQNSFSQGFNMQLLGSYNPSNTTMTNGFYSALWGYVAPDNSEYAILGAFDGTYFYKVDMSGGQLVGFVPAPTPGEGGNSWREMKTYSHYAYIVSESDTSGVQIVDLQYLPDSVHYVKKFMAPGHSSTHSISQTGPYIYLNGANSSFGNGTVVLDLTGDPENPVVRGKWLEEYVHDCRIINDTMWASNISAGKLTVIDVSNKDSLRTITSWQTLPDPFTHNSALTTDHKYIFTTDETSNPPGKLKIWNIQDLNNVIYEGSWRPPGFENTIVHNVEVYGDFAVIAHYSAGVRVLNISDPTNPYEVCWYDTYPDNNSTSYNGCWGLYKFPSDIIIASDRKYGLFVLDPDLNPTPAVPDADFTASPLTVEVGESVHLYDLTSGVPDTWNWTITGNENINSTEQNPLITFNQVGQYTVKLRASNNLGADSITKTNYINVTPTVLHSFTFTNSGIQRVVVSPGDSNKVTFSWTKSSSSPTVSYKFRGQKFGGSEFFLVNSNNSGQDTSITFRKSYLDSVASNFGALVNDSVLIQCKAYAYNGFDSLASGNNLILNILRVTVGITPISTEIPNVFKLENNYPNPFNPETNIRYQIPKAAVVTIKLYDVTGREVSTLVNERHDAGYYNYRFNGEGLTSGVYFYSIQAGDYKDVKRMMLIK